MDAVFGPAPFGDVAPRPKHPDFWRISETLLDHDAELGPNAGPSTEEKDKIWEERVARVVDPESVRYAAMNRVFLVKGRRPASQEEARQWASQMAMWIDAFVAGARYQQRGGHQEP